MLFYISLFTLIFIVLNLKETKLIKGLNLNGVTTAFFIIFIISAFRFDVGYDFSMYYHFIEGDIKFIDDQLNRLEILSRALIDLSHYVGFNQLFFIASSLIIIYLFYLTIKRYSLDPILSTLIFISFPIYLFQSFSIVRQYIAIAIIFYSYRFIKTQKIGAYLLFVFLAFLFHKSAILAIPLYYLFSLHNYFKILIFGLYLLSFFSSDIIAYTIGFFTDQYDTYIEGATYGKGGDMLLILFQVIGFFLLPMVYIIKVKNEKDLKFYLMCFYIGIFIWSSLSKFGHAGIRGGLYFMVFFILLVPNLKTKIKQYYIIRYSLFITCFALFTFNLYIKSKHEIKDANMPYQFFLNKSVKDLEPNE
jgi:hypothetical protein